MRFVVRAGGRHVLGGVPLAVGLDGVDAPARCFFGVVAGLTCAEAVDGGGGTAARVGSGVVGVPDRGVTVGGSTGVVPERDEPCQSGGEQARARFHGDQSTRGGVAIEPAQGGFGPLVGDGVTGQAAGDRRGHRSVSRHVRRGARTTEQGLIGQHEVDRDRGRYVGGLAGDALVRGVGHHLTTPTTIATHVGGTLERGVDRNPPNHGQQHGHVAHVVRRGTDGHGAFALSPHGAVHDGLRVEFVGNGFGLCGDARIAFAFELGLVRAHLFIEFSAVLDAQAGRLAHDQGGPPFRERTSFQRGQGVRHLVDQGAGEAQVAATDIGRVMTGQRDLTGQTAPPFGRRHALGCLAGAALRIECGGQSGLPGGCDALEVFEFGDALDQRRLVGIGIDVRQSFEHVCEYNGRG